MNIPILPEFPGWRPLKPDEVIEYPHRIVCVNPANPNSRGDKGNPPTAGVAGIIGWNGLRLEDIHGRSLNPDYWFYSKTDYKRPLNLRNPKPLPLP